MGWPQLTGQAWPNKPGLADALATADELGFAKQAPLGGTGHNDGLATTEKTGLTKQARPGGWAGHA